MIDVQSIPPPALQSTVTISGLTSLEYAIILRCLKHCSAGHMADFDERGLSLPGYLYNQLSSKLAL